MDLCHLLDLLDMGWINPPTTIVSIYEVHNNQDKSGRNIFKICCVKSMDMIQVKISFINREKCGTFCNYDNNCYAYWIVFMKEVFGVVQRITWTTEVTQWFVIRVSFIPGTQMESVWAIYCLGLYTWDREGNFSGEFLIL